jgi:hypothetical protein
MRLYHTTTAANAEAIRREGFRDGKGHYGTDRLLRGVWLSNVPLDVNDFGGPLDADVLLRVDVTCDEKDLARFECIEEGKRYREWLVPAKVLSRFISNIVVLSTGEDDVSEEP